MQDELFKLFLLMDLVKIQRKRLVLAGIGRIVTIPIKKMKTAEHLMNTCYYQIQTYSFQPTKKAKGLEERKEAFRKRLKKIMDEVDPNLKKYPAWLRKDFWEYWTALDNDFGRKMKFEKEKSWNTKLRLNTWRRNASKDKRWNEPAKAYTPPKKQNVDYGRIDYEAKKRFSKDQSISEVIGAGERLRKNWKS